MPGIYEWAKSKLTPIQTAIHDAVSAIKQTTSQISTFAYHIYHSPLTRHYYEIYIRDFFPRNWKGFSRVLDPSVVPALINSKKTTPILVKSFKANILLYIGTVLFYEAGVKRVMRIVPGMEDSYLEYATNTLSLLYFMRTATTMFVDNTFYGWSISKAAQEENPNNEHYQSDGCSTTAAVQANLKSSIDYIGNTIAIYLINKAIPIIGPFAAFLLRVMLSGHCFVEYKLSSAGMSANQRNDILFHTNGFSLGLGLSFYLNVLAANELIKRATGVDSYFIFDAVFSFLFHYYTMLAYLIKEPLPRDENQLDVFRYSRYQTALMAREGCKGLMSKLSETGCDLVVTNTYPAKARLYQLPGSSYAAYVMVVNKGKVDALYYANKSEDKCEELLTKKPADFKKAVDFFESKWQISHWEINAFSALSSDDLSQIAENTRHHHLPYDWNKKLRALLSFPPIHLMKLILIAENLRSLDKFIEKPAVKTFFDIYGESLQATVNWLIEVRKEDSLEKRFIRATEWMPTFLSEPLKARYISQDKDVQKLINMLLTGNIDEALNKIKLFIEKARIRVTILDEKALEALTSFDDDPIVKPKQEALLLLPSSSQSSELLSNDSEKSAIQSKEVNDFEVIPQPMVSGNGSVKDAANGDAPAPSASGASDLSQNKAKEKDLDKKEEAKNDFEFEVIPQPMVLGNPSLNDASKDDAPMPSASHSSALSSGHQKITREGLLSNCNIVDDYQPPSINMRRHSVSDEGFILVSSSNFFQTSSQEDKPSTPSRRASRQPGRQ